jgi:hypothetical protein
MSERPLPVDERAGEVVIAEPSIAFTNARSVGCRAGDDAPCDRRPAAADLKRAMSRCHRCISSQHLHIGLGRLVYTLRLA